MAHFRIDFEWLTEHVRNLWAEGNYPLAQETLVGTLPVEKIRDIIRGTKKMIQDPEGIKGVDGLLTDDNWKPSLSNCWLGRYPDPSDMETMRWVREIGQKRIGDILFICKAITSSTNYLDKLRLGSELSGIPLDFFTWLGQDEIRDFLVVRRMEISNRATGRYGRILYNNDPFETELPNAISPGIRPTPQHLIQDLSDVDTWVKRQLELDKKPKPKPDKTFSVPTGYILPNGKFYSCGWMEHRWLADVLENITHEKAQERGWIEISHPFNQPHKLQIILGNKEPTEAQLGTLAEWELKYQGEIINPAGEW